MEDLTAADQITIESHSNWRKFELYAKEKDQDGNPAKPARAKKMVLAVKIKERLKGYRMLSLPHMYRFEASASTTTIAESRENANKQTTDEALAVHQILLNSPPPAQTTVRAMRSWFVDLDGPGKLQSRSQLWGASIRKYDDINDLVALQVPADQDRLSAFILHNFGVFFQTAGQEGEGSSAYVSERAVARFVVILSILCTLSGPAFRIYHFTVFCA